MPDSEAAPTPSTPVAHPVSPSQVDGVARALARSFVGDPVWVWLTGSRHARFAERAQPFFRAELRHYLHLEGAWTVDGELGGSLWAPPKSWKLSPLDIARLVPSSVGLFGPRLLKALKVLDEIDRQHPSEPHHYLAFVGTDPDHQGRGIGSSLLRPVLDRCDEEGMPAYLESSKEANVPFYERHGFAVTSTHDLPGPDGPRMWLMWREPRAPQV